MNAVLGVGRIGSTVKVQKLATILERLQPMCKACGDQQALAVSRREFLAMPAQERRRTPAQINRNVEHPTCKARNELYFRMRRVLKVHAPDCAFARGHGA